MTRRVLQDSGTAQCSPVSFAGRHDERIHCASVQPAPAVSDGSGACRFQDSAAAEPAAALALAALELNFKRFEGQGSARHFEAGRDFELTDSAAHKR